MISRPDDPYKGLMRTFRVALVVSLLIHPLIIALLQYQLHFRSPQQIAKLKQDPNELVTISSATKHSSKTVAAAEPASHDANQPVVKHPKVEPHTQHVAQTEQLAKPVPQKVQRPVPVRSYPPPIPQKQELAKTAPGTPVPKAAPTSLQTPTLKKEPPKVVAEVQKPSVVQHQIQPRAGKYSEAQIAQIESDLSKSIRGDRGMQNPLSNVNDRTVAEAPRHYGIDFRAANGDDRAARGICDPISSWQQGGYDYYYLACNVVEPDGSMNRKALPWPVRYKPDNDPNVGTGDSRTPIAGPLPGWHPPLGHPMDPDFANYARQLGYNF